MTAFVVKTARQIKPVFDGIFDPVIDLVKPLPGSAANCPSCALQHAMGGVLDLNLHCPPTAEMITPDPPQNMDRRAVPRGKKRLT